MPSFDALMALASKQTEASQVAFVKEQQLRQAREKARRLEEERKEKERIRLEKERLAKQKLEEEKREKRLLEERQKRQAERAAASELAHKQELDSISRSSSSRIQTKSTQSPHNRSIGRASSSTPTLVKDPEEQRRLDREEKQARARARLFGEPVSAHKKASSSRPSTSTSQRNSTSSKSKTLLSGSTMTKNSKISTAVTARQRIEQQFSVNDRQPLNQNRRDRRTIDEHDQDMKRKKALMTGEAKMHPKGVKDNLSDSNSTDKKVLLPSKMAASGSVLKELQSPPTGSVDCLTMKRKALNALAAPSSKRVHSSNVPPRLTGTTSDLRRPSTTSQSSRPSNKYRQSADQSDDEDDSEYEDYSDQEADVAPSIRDEIWKIMGKDRKVYATKPIFSDDEGSDDMEADVDDVFEEEGRAARLAKLEDRKEEERLRQHELEKKKRLYQSRPSK